MLASARPASAPSPPISTKSSAREFSPRSIGLAETLRVLKDAFLDKVGDRVEVDGRGVTAESQRFERDSAASSEAVQNLGRPVRVGVGEQLCGADRCAGSLSTLRRKRLPRRA